MLELKPNGSLLDLGCGQGVLARHLPKGVEYWGVDSSPSLIETAKRLTKGGHFVVGDASREIEVKKDFDWACLILSLQNMEHPQGAISAAGRHLKKGGKLLIVLNHPCFRIPRQSHWGVDEEMKLQYRRLNSYMSAQKIPIQTNPGKGEKSAATYSYHYPISSYSEWLHKEGFQIALMQEWCSDKKSEGGKAKMEDRARREFPLFLAILATR
ncbi:MAG TPA: class I SAM-dependent methyltransferase [Chlamydiales bacterium]|nr:class I SAM-dependent methyltransferase [Chlamydiales bacterium]